MKTSRRGWAAAFVCLFALVGLGAQGLSSPQKIRSLDDPAWADLEAVLRDAGLVEVSAARPYPDARIREELAAIDPGRLSEPARRAYERLSATLGVGSRAELPAYQSRLGLSLAPALQWRSTRAIDWIEGYADRAPLLSLPVELAFADRVYGTVDFSLKPDPDMTVALPGPGFGFNLAELAANSRGMDGTFPFRAFGSAGGSWWNLQVGRDRLDFGGAGRYDLTISSAAEFYDFARLSLSSRTFAYTGLVVQLNPQRNLYSHRYDFRPWENLSISLGESLLVGVAPLELRYFNPLMIFHGYEPWHDYGTTGRPWPTGTGSEIGIGLDWSPMPYLLLSGQYAMTQLEDPIKKAFWPDAVSTIPDGEAFLGGASLRLPLRESFLVARLWAAYTTPMAYLLTGDPGTVTPAGIDENPTSWIYDRPTMSNWPDGSGRSRSWIGFADGPDTELLALSAGLDRGSEGSLLADVGWKARGTYADIANSNLGINNWPERPEFARLRTPSGTPEYVLVAGLSARRDLSALPWGLGAKLSSSIHWTGIWNSGHVVGRFVQGWEFDLDYILVRH